MRCKTPMIRVLLIGASDHPLASCCTNGNQYIRYPSRKMMAALLNIFHNTDPVPRPSNFFCEKLMALPTANKKEGKTRSVGVKPNQTACSRGGNAVAPLPGVFTMIIKQIVIPRNTSSERNRFGFWSMFNKRFKIIQEKSGTISELIKTLEV